MTVRKHIFAIFATVLLFSCVTIAAPQTFIGVVSDDMCTREHTMMPGKPDSECVRACVKGGSKYALVSSDKMFVLKGDSKQLDRLAGKTVKVTGEVSGTTLKVSSIEEAK